MPQMRMHLEKCWEEDLKARKLALTSSRKRALSDESDETSSEKRQRKDEGNANDDDDQDDK